MKKENYQALFVPDYQNLEKLIAGYRAAELKIVLLSGVFDLVHIGHALYAQKAKELGDILVVGVDTDELVKKDKGPKRPIVSQDERVSMLRFFRQIDVVTLNIAHGELIKLIRPDILVLSESTNEDPKVWEEKMKKEYRYLCSEIVILPPQATTSTTARIRLNVIEGARDLANALTKVIEDHMERLKGGGL